MGRKGPRRRPAGERVARRSEDAALETVVVEPGARRRPAIDRPTRSTAGPAPVRLVDLAADWLSTVLALGQYSELPDAAAIRARALELRSRLEREAAAAGFSTSDVEDAVFAMVAFLDETVLNGRGAARDVWIARPLQLELYGRQLAGEEFFERLDRLRGARDAGIEALEVYCCCLAFGFAGRYRLAPAEKLGALLEDVQRDVAAARGTGRSPLAPNAGHRSERVDAAEAGLAWWVPLAFAVPTIVLVYLIVWLLARLGAGHAAAAIRGLLA